jgi:hypothetical protein
MELPLNCYAGTIWYDAATAGNIVTTTQIGEGTKTYYAQASVVLVLVQLELP